MHLKGLLTFIILLYVQPITVVAANFIEGQHYLTLKSPKSKQPEIREFFSFYCPHCYNQEPFMKELQNKLPSRAKFVKNHVEGMPNRNSEVEKLLTKALIIGDRMRVKDKLVDAIFKKIHVNKGDFKSADDIKQLFMSFGVSEIMYDSTASSFSVDIKYNDMKHKANTLRAQGHSSVPTLIINGKYKPITTQITSMGQYKELIYFLLKK
ncbi:thiol:disulfide interchange protein DsbA/DsbL [Thalassotalea atypica]|uniref:thiol:disulfide interchange protein DsbA/DsbL n=1 Tax=Thalassotalea atypica TaxID=2054316 RepID=UPI002572D215|nr:thiol:disulfide interchange protein DsbA/DsbL [Thalassotalea atypica]